MYSLVIGSSPPDGSLKALLAKVTGINSKHGPFSCILALGDLFPEKEDDEDTAAILAGTLAVPVPMYFMMGSRPLPAKVQAKVDKDAGELADNLFFLGEAPSNPRCLERPS